MSQQVQPQDVRSKPNRPVHTVRFGSIKAAIWDNQTQHGVMHNVTVSRSYRDDRNNWQESGSFSVDELLALAKALDQAHSWIHLQRAAAGRD